MKESDPQLHSSKDTSSEEKQTSKKEVTERKCFKTKSSLDMVPPDGGWGWMVVLGSFLIMILGTFPMFAFGILFSPILMSYGVSSTKISWIFNFHSLIWSCYTVFIGPLCDEFGWRKVAIFGGAANFLSVFLSSFASTPDYLFFSFSLLGGIGGSTSYSLSFFVVSKYFKKHQGLAIGITTIGACVSIFAAPIVANYLLENYGYMGASLIFGAIVLNQCVGGSLYQPVEWHLKPVKCEPERDVILKEKLSLTGCEDLCIETTEMKFITKIRKSSIASTDSHSSSYKSAILTLLNEEIDTKKSKFKYSIKTSKFINILKSTYENLKILKYRRVQLVAMSYCCLMLGYINFQMWIPFVITNAGYSLEVAAWCSSLVSIGNLSGRIVMTLLSDRKLFNVEYGYMFGLLLIGSSITAFSFVEDIKFYMILSCIWGVGLGSSLSLIISAIIKVMGVEMLPAVIGVSSLLKGFGGITLGTLIGVVRDATDSYKYGLLILGALEFLAFFMWLLLSFNEKIDKLNNSNLSLSLHTKQDSLNDI